MTWDTFRALGGIEGGLARRADTILAEHYTPDQQAELRSILLRLIQPGEGVIDTRRRVALADLAPTGGMVDAVQVLIKPLIDARLLTSGTDEHDQETIEISHEALIQAWPTLGAWINAARENLRFQFQLEQAAKEWQSSRESADFLWSGLRLANAEAWIERSQPRLNARDQAFLDASRTAVQARAAIEEAARTRELHQAQMLATAEQRNVSRLRRFLVLAGGCC